MKFLLVGINSKYIHSNPAIHYLKLYAGEEYQNTVELAEYTINHLKEQILSDIYRRSTRYCPAGISGLEDRRFPLKEKKCLRSFLM